MTNPVIPVPIDDHDEDLAVIQKPFKIQVADRISHLPPYLFARINQLRDQKRRAGADVIDMAMGNPSDPPSEMVIEKLCEAARDLHHGYAPAAGIKNLRREVASRYLKKWGVRLDPESEVISTLGSKEGFGHLCLAIIGPGDRAIVPALLILLMCTVLRLASGTTMLFDTTDPSRYLSDIARTCEAAAPCPKMVIVNFPHNPTATVVGSDFYEEVVKLAKRHSFMLVSDLAYADVTFDGYFAPSVLSVEGAKNYAVEFTTMSKGFNMAGWRVGFVLGARRLCGHSEQSKLITTTACFVRFRLLRSWHYDTERPTSRYKPKSTSNEEMCSAKVWPELDGLLTFQKRRCLSGPRFQNRLPVV